MKSPNFYTNDKKLFDQIEQIKAKKKKAAPAAEAASKQSNKDVNAGGMNFKDQPPFEDDLPF